MLEVGMYGLDIARYSVTIQKHCESQYKGRTEQLPAFMNVHGRAAADDNVGLFEARRGLLAVLQASGYHADE